MAVDGSAAFFREKADELRDMAAGMLDRTIAAQILRLVAQYDDLATNAERMPRF
jgi:hypothetical protein